MDIGHTASNVGRTVGKGAQKAGGAVGGVAGKVGDTLSHAVFGGLTHTIMAVAIVGGGVAMVMVIMKRRR